MLKDKKNFGFTQKDLDKLMAEDPAMGGMGVKELPSHKKSKKMSKTSIPSCYTPPG